ncbi:MAG: radical SAM protein [archaeon]
MKILLIKPKWYLDYAPYKYTEVIRFPPVNLGIIAALSNGHDVRIIDEDGEQIPYNEKFDLVGITIVAFTADRAFKIADKFRKNGVKVILGGIHPSLVPKDCIKHADSVAIGEVEYTWKEILADAKKGKLKRIYDCSKIKVNMDDIPFPRRDLYNQKYTFEAFQATKGCSHGCRFCYLSDVPWSSFKTRSIPKVIDEIKQIKTPYIIFLDDNLFLNKNYARELFKAMIPLKKLWWAQAPSDIYKDEELVRLMSKSGCYAVAIGFQSFNPSSLENAHVLHNKVSEYQTLIKLLHKYNIMVQSFFIFGFDSDTKAVFKDTVTMIKKLDIDDAYLYILTPYPGTGLYKELEKEGRIVVKDLSKYNWYNCVFTPKNMTIKDMHEGIRWSYNELTTHFRRQLPRKFLKYWRLAVTNPHLAQVIVKGQLNKIDLNKLT